MMKLYSNPQSRGMTVMLLLQELGITTRLKL